MIGAGYFAGFQAEAWSRLPTASIVAIVDTEARKATEFAARHGIPRTYTSAEAMLDGDAGPEPAELGVHHRAKVSGRVVMEFNDAARLAVEHDGHAATNVGGNDGHRAGNLLEA